MLREERRVTTEQIRHALGPPLNAKWCGSAPHSIPLLHRCVAKAAAR